MFLNLLFILGIYLDDHMGWSFSRVFVLLVSIS